jgi:hypothetical protein
MHRSVLLAFVSIFTVASVALAATGGDAPKSTLAQAVSKTNTVSSMRYVMVIAVAREHYPAMQLQVHGTRTTEVLYEHIKAYSSILSGGPAIPGPQQSALLDGPFLYEGSPDGIPIAGKIRWLRVPTARIGPSAKALVTMHNLSPAPLLRLVDEWSYARTRTLHGVFRGTVAYDDRIVQAALTGMTGGIQFRDVSFIARVGSDGYVHSIAVRGKTADGTRSVSATVRMFAFGRPARVAIPGEGTFVDQKSLTLAE